MKRFSIGIVAVLMAIGFAAFTKPQTAVHKPAFNNYYRYLGTTNAGMKDPQNYVWTDNLDGCNNVTEVVCIISSPGSTGTNVHPSFPNNTDPYSNSAGVTVEFEKSLP